MIKLRVNYISSISPHKQIGHKFLQAIQKGDISRGTRLPSVSTLSKELSVSASVVEHAYRRLIKEHLVLYRKGDGYYVGDEVPFSETTSLATVLGTR